MTRPRGASPEELTEQQFFDNFDALDKAADQFGVFGHAAHVNLKEGKAFCFMSGPDEDSSARPMRRSIFHMNSITEVRRVSGADMRVPQPAKAQKHKAR